MQTTIYDVVIAGGGISGLAAAHELLLRTPKLKVLVLEARDRLGGRIHTFRSEDGKHFADLGASFVHGVKGNPIAKLAKDLDLPLHFTGPNFGTAREHTGKVLDPAIAMIVARNIFGTLFSGLEILAQNGAETPLASTPLSTPLFASDSTLFADLESPEAQFYAKTMARSFEGWTGAGLENVSFKWWGWWEEFDGEDAYMSAGYSKVIDWLGGEIRAKGGEIRLGEEVKEMELLRDPGDDDDGITGVKIGSHSSSESSQKYSYQARTALVTLPLGVLKACPPVFTPPLPNRRLKAIENLGFGLLNKVTLTYDDVWWPKDEAVMIFLPDPNASTALVGPTASATAQPRAAFITNLWTRSQIPALQWFFGGDSGEALEAHSDEEIAKWAEDSLVQYLGSTVSSSSIPPPTKVIVTRWRSDPYALGSYTYMPVAGDTDKGAGAASFSKEGGSPLDMLETSHPLWERHLFFAGEHTSVDHFASVHGAYLSGIKAAGDINLALDV